MELLNIPLLFLICSVSVVVSTVSYPLLLHYLFRSSVIFQIFDFLCLFSNYLLVCVFIQLLLYLRRVLIDQFAFFFFSNHCNFV